MNWETLLRHAHVPYSGEREACLIIGHQGYYPGVRVENIAYPQTITALQGAMGLCLSCGDVPVRIFQPPSREKDPAADETVWRTWFEHHMQSPEWIYTDQLPDGVSDVLSEMKNPLSVTHKRLKVPPSDSTSSSKSDLQAAGNEPFFEDQRLTLTSLFIDAVQPEYDKARRRLLAELTQLAYTPHSDFPVSALLETDKGLVGGVNVEFEIWNFGLCAERNAIHTAIAYGARPTGTIAVFAPKSQLCSPCGMCRQTLAEWPFMERVLLYHGDGSCSEHRIEDLLPLHFKASSLGSDPKAYGR